MKKQAYQFVAVTWLVCSLIDRRYSVRENNGKIWNYGSFFFF